MLIIITIYDHLSLQEEGVAEHRVERVIQTVLHNLADREVGQLPSPSTQGRFASEMKAISREQIRESLGDGGLTLKYDGTTKKRVGHIVEVELSTGDYTYLVGMRQQAGGLATDYVESINSSIETIEPEVFGRVENTMTDRCSTNSSVDQLLGEQMNKKLNSFRCAMHPLDSFAKKADAVLKSNEGEDWVRKGSQPHHRRGESSCQALLRAADKLFNNPASGDPNALRSYLTDKGLPSSLPRWVGNRFNILFKNASILLLIGDTIVYFFSKVQKPQNDLQRAFVNLWSVQQKCHLRCLTLLHKTFTAPWMEEVSKETPILQMNDKFRLAHSTLQKWQQQPESSLSGETAFGGQIKKDATWELLHGNCDADKTAMLELFVQLIKGILDVMDRQLASQLPGGEFWEPDADTVRAAQSCTATNISGERNFAHLDASLHRAPNSSLPKAEEKSYSELTLQGPGWNKNRQKKRGM